MNMASYPNLHYICSNCKKDLGSRRNRLLNPAEAVERLDMEEELDTLLESFKQILENEKLEEQDDN